MNDDDLPERGSVFEQHAPADLPAMQGEALLITYEGDIRNKLRACGTRTPFRLNSDGDTEQLVEAHFNPDAVPIGADGPPMTETEQAEGRRYAERMLVQDAAKNGRVKSSRWVNLPKPATVIKDDEVRRIVAIPCDPERRAAAGIKNFRKWPDAKKVQCESCGADCWIGPRQAAAKRDRPDWPVYCLICQPPSGKIQHLGSDFDAFDIDLKKAAANAADLRSEIDKQISAKITAFEAMQDPGYWSDHYDELAREVAELTKRKLWRHQLVGDVFKRLNLRIHNTRPEHAIGTKLWAEFVCAETILDKDDKRACFDGSEKRANEVALDILVAVRLAEVFLWTEKTEQIARAAPLPKHTISPSVMPQRAMFWAREQPHGDEKRISNWFVLTHHKDRISVAHDEMNPDGSRIEIRTFAIDYGKVWPNDFVEGAVDIVGTILKFCAFLNSPFVMSAKQKLPRHIRRQLERQEQSVPDDHVSVVVLRRALVKKPQVLPNTEHPGVEWKHHWWVGDHYRAQWYPSEQAHRVIWIAPFIKGDLSKPLLEKVYAVVR